MNKCLIELEKRNEFKKNNPKKNEIDFWDYELNDKIEIENVKFNYTPAEQTKEIILDFWDDEIRDNIIINDEKEEIIIVKNRFTPAGPKREKYNFDEEKEIELTKEEKELNDFCSNQKNEFETKKLIDDYELFNC